MTRKDLIEIISNDTSCFSCPEYSCDMPEEEGNTGECCRRCAEKQLAEYEGNILVRDTPKRPRKEWNSDHTRDWPVCPTCGLSVEGLYRQFKFCPECGQRLDWSE